MDSTTSERLAGREVATDLKASIAARRELGYELVKITYWSRFSRECSNESTCRYASKFSS